MKTGTSKRVLFISLFVIIMTAVFLCYASVGYADALSYDGTELSSLWYYGDSGLQIDSAKSVVDTWDKGNLSQKIIAVIDTGIDYKHEVFDGVLYTDADGNPVGYDSRTKQEISLDEMKDTHTNKHGNAIAGVIAMMIKEFGLQDYVKIYPIKANAQENGSDKDTFTVDPVIEAIKQADRIGADAINMSLGILKKESSVWATSADLKTALEEASANVLIVAAAGNDGLDCDANENNLFYPAAHDGVLGIMAYGSTGLYSDSNYGSVYGIACPGDKIYTAKNIDNLMESDGYQYLDGTSLASPIAAFAGALIKLRYDAESKTAPKGLELARIMRNLACRTVIKSGNEIKCLDFNTVVTQDFETTDFKYDAPTSIGLSHNGTYGQDVYDETIYMRANAVSPITFTAKINPFGKTDPALDSAVQWIIKRSDFTETVLGYGLKFDYTPTYIDEIVTIVARLRYGEQTFEQEEDVFLSSVAFMVGDARVTFAKNALDGVDNAPSSGIIYVNETAVFSLTGIEFVSESKKKGIQWYVDGVLAGEGETFEYSPKSAGKHTISARFDGNPIPREFTAIVRPFILRPLDLSMLIIGLAVAVAVITVVIVICVKRKKALSEKSDGDNSEAANG